MVVCGDHTCLPELPFQGERGRWPCRHFLPWVLLCEEVEQPPANLVMERKLRHPKVVYRLSHEVRTVR